MMIEGYGRTHLPTWQIVNRILICMNLVQKRIWYNTDNIKIGFGFKYVCMQLTDEYLITVIFLIYHICFYYYI